MQNAFLFISGVIIVADRHAIYQMKAYGISNLITYTI